MKEPPLLSTFFPLSPGVLSVPPACLYPFICVFALSLLFYTGVFYRDTFILESAGVVVWLITLEAGADGCVNPCSFFCFGIGSNNEAPPKDLFYFCFRRCYFANDEEGEPPDSIAMLKIFRLNKLFAPESTGALNLSGDRLNC